MSEKVDIEIGLADLMVQQGQAFYLSSKIEQTDCLFYIAQGDGEEVHVYAATSRFSLDGPMYYDCTVPFTSGCAMPCDAIEYLLGQMAEGSDWKEGKLTA